MPRDRHCGRTHAGLVQFLKIAPQASARCPCHHWGCPGPQASAHGHDWPMPKSYRPAQASARSPCCQCGGPRAVSQPHTMSKTAILHRFPNFYTLRVEIFRMFFIRSRLRMTPINHEKFYGNLVCTFPKSAIQTDRCSSFIYIDRSVLFWVQGLQEASKPVFSFCVYFVLFHILLQVRACFCSVIFSFSVLSQEIGWDEGIQNDLFCVGRDIKA